MREHLPRLLLADDDAAILHACACAFALEGYDVRTASNGRAALAQIRDWHPQVAVMDVEMPIMDGREVARQVRAFDENRLTLLIAVTGLCSLTERLTSLRAGFNYHFTKPLKLDALLQTLAMHARLATATR